MLKQTCKAVIPVLAITLLAACGNNPTNQSSGNTEDTATAAVAAAPVKLKDEKAQQLYQHYVHLTTALANDDSAEAKNAGNAIEAAAKEVPAAATIGQNAQRIAAAPTLAAQREQYIGLSNEMLALVKATGLSSGELYVDFCPMANNEEGAVWLSATKAIKNPYFGNEMPTCGEIKETIK
jgi:hypothetical protein